MISPTEAQASVFGDQSKNDAMSEANETIQALQDINDELKNAHDGLKQDNIALIQENGMMKQQLFLLQNQKVAAQNDLKAFELAGLKAFQNDNNNIKPVLKKNLDEEIMFLVKLIGD